MASGFDGNKEPQNWENEGRNDRGNFDYDEAVAKVDHLVGHYLDALDEIKHEDLMEHFPLCVQKVRHSWHALERQLVHVGQGDPELKLADIRLNSYQTELELLEEVYMKVDLELRQSTSETVELATSSAAVLLERMDELLAGLGFSEEHKDRVFVRDIMKDNNIRRREIKKKAV